MVNEYAEEMFDLQMELREIALQLEYCNWDCVTFCSQSAMDLLTKSQCFE